MKLDQQIEKLEADLKAARHKKGQLWLKNRKRANKVKIGKYFHFLRTDAWGEISETFVYVTSVNENDSLLFGEELQIRRKDEFLTWFGMIPCTGVNVRDYKEITKEKYETALKKYLTKTTLKLSGY